MKTVDEWLAVADKIVGELLDPKGRYDIEFDLLRLRAVIIAARAEIEKKFTGVANEEYHKPEN